MISKLCLNTICSIRRTFEILEPDFQDMKYFESLTMDERTGPNNLTGPNRYSRPRFWPEVCWSEIKRLTDRIGPTSNFGKRCQKSIKSAKIVPQVQFSVVCMWECPTMKCSLFEIKMSKVLFSFSFGLLFFTHLLQILPIARKMHFNS